MSPDSSLAEFYHMSTDASDRVNDLIKTESYLYDYPHMGSIDTINTFNTVSSARSFNSSDLNSEWTAASSLVTPPIKEEKWASLDQLFEPSDNIYSITQSVSSASYWLPDKTPSHNQNLCTETNDLNPQPYTAGLDLNEIPGDPEDEKSAIPQLHDFLLNLEPSIALGLQTEDIDRDLSYLGPQHRLSFDDEQRTFQAVELNREASVKFEALEFDTNLNIMESNDSYVRPEPVNHRESTASQMLEFSANLPTTPVPRPTEKSFFNYNDGSDILLPAVDATITLDNVSFVNHTSGGDIDALAPSTLPTLRPLTPDSPTSPLSGIPGSLQHTFHSKPSANIDAVIDDRAKVSVNSSDGAIFRPASRPMPAPASSFDNRFRPLVINGNRDISGGVWSTLEVSDQGNGWTLLKNKHLILAITETHKCQLNVLEYKVRSMLMDELKVDPCAYLNGKQVIEKCIELISSVSSERGDSDFFDYMTPVDASADYGPPVSKRCGIPQQLEPPKDSVPHPCLHELCENMTSKRPRQDPFFKLSIDGGSIFHLVELQRAVKIVMSRPPRRRNHYPAPQIDGRPTNGWRACVGSFSQKLDPKGVGLFRSTSNSMRVVRAHAPPPVSDGAVVQHVASSSTCSHALGSRAMYKPTYVKGKGSLKSGWCDHCKDGGFYKMKNSGYLYHKNHEHGVYANDSVFEDPLMIRCCETREMRWEGLCGICYRWVEIDHRCQNRWSTWFRHYNRCSKEYDDIKCIILQTGAPVKFVEFDYRPYISPEELKNIQE